jgi:hypothetical protein
MQDPPVLVDKADESFLLIGIYHDRVCAVILPFVGN